MLPYNSALNLLKASIGFHYFVRLLSLGFLCYVRNETLAFASSYSLKNSYS